MIVQNLKINLNIDEKKDPRFRDKNTENFYHGQRVLKFQELSRSEKQEARRKVVIIYRAKS